MVRSQHEGVGVLCISLALKQGGLQPEAETNVGGEVTARTLTHLVALVGRVPEWGVHSGQGKLCWRK